MILIVLYRIKVFNFDLQAKVLHMVTENFGFEHRKKSTVIATVKATDTSTKNRIENFGDEIRAVVFEKNEKEFEDQ